jgi:ketosteroid isomerase-like protein
MSPQEAIEELLAEAEIRKAMARYCRGVDRRDEELVRSVYHEDSIDEHGWVFPMNGWEIADDVSMRNEWGDVFKSIHHFLGSHYIEVDGDTARSEVYFIANHRFEGDGSDWDMVFAGRYLDRWERRGGSFKIAHRLCIYDWTRTDRLETPWPGPDHVVPKWSHGEAPIGPDGEPVMDLAKTTWGVCGPGDASHGLFPRLSPTDPSTPKGRVAAPIGFPRESPR